MMGNGAGEFQSGTLRFEMLSPKAAGARLRGSLLHRILSQASWSSDRSDPLAVRTCEHQTSNCMVTMMWRLLNLGFER